MKKLYSTPDMEVKAFEVEDIMSVSTAPQDVYTATDAADGVATVNYSDLFYSLV